MGLALCLESQKVLRENLRILVMSATLDTGKIASLLGNAPIIHCEGRVFPIETRYLSKPDPKMTEHTVVQAVKNAFFHNTGNLLVFLPGMAEIRRIKRGLQRLNLGSPVHLAPLYGDLSQSDQDRAIQPPPPGQRKIVLATNIAETSLTIEGIRVVIDTGLVRVARFDPRSGMNRLETIKVSKDSADQRQGRAGRIEPGVCYRLWTAGEHQGLLQRTTPEMLESDLSSLVLELALWGTNNPNELFWLDDPPTGAYCQARKLLVRLGALNNEGHITPHGKQMAELPLHPRLAHMVLRAQSLGLEGLACELAALLSERDFLKAKPGERNTDLRVRIDVLQNPKIINQAITVDRSALLRIHQSAEQLKRQLTLTPGKRETKKRRSGDSWATPGFCLPGPNCEMSKSRGTTLPLS